VPKLLNCIIINFEFLITSLHALKLLKDCWQHKFFLELFVVMKLFNNPVTGVEVT
jgi:hypothetical protein